MCGWDGVSFLLVDDMCHSIGDDDVRNYDLSFVDEDCVAEDRDGEVCALETWDGGVGEFWGEEDVAGYDVVCENVGEGFGV